jgi:phosphoribosylformylglycinamidine synthase
MIKARIYVTLKPSVLDPQGKVITSSLHTLGYDSVIETRASKFFEMSFEGGDILKVSKLLEEICDKLLANPNTEVYRYEIEKD